MLGILGLIFLVIICFILFIIVGCAFHGGMDYFCNEQEISKRLDNFADNQIKSLQRESEREMDIQLIRKQLEEDINYLRIKLNDEIICRQLDYKNITDFLKKKGNK